MKSRKGFVSNSSSSSFVVNEPIRDTLFKIFRRTVLYRGFSDNNYHSSNISKKIIERYRSNLKKALKREDVVNNDIGIIVPTMISNIFIKGEKKEKKKCYVDLAPKYWKWNEIFEVSNFNNEIVSNFMEDNKFFFLNIKNNIIHTQIFSSEKMKNDVCSVCKQRAFGFYVEDNKGNKRCSYCFRGILRKYKKDVKKRRFKKWHNAINLLKL